jgi:hypothetical protein
MQWIVYASSTDRSEFLQMLPMQKNMKGTSMNGDVSNQENIREFYPEMYISFRNTGIYCATLLNVTRISREQEIERSSANILVRIITNMCV